MTYGIVIPILILALIAVLVAVVSQPIDEADVELGEVPPETSTYPRQREMSMTTPWESNPPSVDPVAATHVQDDANLLETRIRTSSAAEILAPVPDVPDPLIADLDQVGPHVTREENPADEHRPISPAEKSDSDPGSVRV
jgi:hypothetical protein